jgi:hypothetical protein
MGFVRALAKCRGKFRLLGLAVALGRTLLLARTGGSASTQVRAVVQDRTSRQ